MISLNRRGQSIAEYAVLFAVVIAAAVAMQTYSKRGIQARVKSGTDALTSITKEITSTNEPALKANFAKQSQYEPYYLETFGQTYQEKVEQEHMGAGKIVRETVSDTTARAAGSSQKQKGEDSRKAADDLWIDPP